MVGALFPLGVLGFLYWLDDGRSEDSFLVQFLCFVAYSAVLGLAAVSYTGAEAWAFEQRGRWTEATVVGYSPARVVPGDPPTKVRASCALETAEGERVRPRLPEGRGCRRAAAAATGCGTGPASTCCTTPGGCWRPGPPSPWTTASPSRSSGAWRPCPGSSAVSPSPGGGKPSGYAARVARQRAEGGNPQPVRGREGVRRFSLPP